MVDVNNIKYSDFQELCKDLNRCLSQYNDSRNSYQDMYYTVYLSNGDRFNYSIPRKSISHLLGINTEEIKLWNIYQARSSFELLNLICEDPYYFHNAMKRSNKSYSSFVSPFIDKKIQIFNSHFISAKDKIKDIEFICKYNRNYCYINGTESKNIDYLVATRKDNFLTLLGLIYQDGEYVPVTSQMIDLDSEEGIKTLSSFIKSQVLTLPETLKSVKSYREEKGYFLDEDLLRKINILEEYAKKYNCLIDVSHAFKFTKKKEIDNRVAVTAACESIISGKPIKDVTFKGKVPKYIEDLFLYIGSLAPESRKGKIKQLEEYKKILNEFEKSKLEIERLNQMVEQQSSIIVELRDAINTLNEENKEQENVIDGIVALASKVRKKS